MGMAPRGGSSTVEIGWGNAKQSWGDRGGDWKSIAISTWRICAKDGVMKHVLLSAYEIYEIIMIRSSKG